MQSPRKERLGPAREGSPSTQVHALERRSPLGKMGGDAERNVSHERPCRRRKAPGAGRDRACEHGLSAFEDQHVARAGAEIDKRNARRLRQSTHVTRECGKSERSHGHSFRFHVDGFANEIRFACERFDARHGRDDGELAPPRLVSEHTPVEDRIVEVERDLGLQFERQDFGELLAGRRWQAQVVDRHPTPVDGDGHSIPAARLPTEDLGHRRAHGFRHRVTRRDLRRRHSGHRKLSVR